MPTKHIRLEDCRILITGASSGIGRALALALARRQARLVLVARRLPLLEEIAQEIIQSGGQPPVLVTADLGLQGAANSVAQQALETLGGIDILVNNAGTSVIGAQHVVGDGVEARTLFETNYWSPLALVKALVPGMRAQGQGVVVNVSSTLQAVPLGLLGYYCSSKTALARATQVMRTELKGSAVAVMEVVPGGTDTPSRGNDRFLPLRKSKLPAPRLVSPESTAQAIVRGLESGAARVVHPASSLLPLELPVIGRIIGSIAALAIDTSSELVVVPAAKQTSAHSTNIKAPH